MRSVWSFILPSCGRRLASHCSWPAGVVRSLHLKKTPVALLVEGEKKALHPPTLPHPAPPLHQSKCWHPNTAFSRPHPLHHSTIRKSAVLLPPTALSEISGWNMCFFHGFETASLQSALKSPLLLSKAARSPCLCWSIYLNAYQWSEVYLGMSEGLFWWCQMSNIWLLIELCVQGKGWRYG